MTKALLIVDVQNDFVTGSLGSDYARDVVVPNIKNLAKEFDYRDRFATMDTHIDNKYLETHEGKRLPVKHCIIGTRGHELVKELGRFVANEGFHRILKSQFAAPSMTLINALKKYPAGYYDEIHICGLCTDICVISNALLLRSIFPETDIIVHENCCGGTSKEAHDAAILIMKNCHIDIV